MDRWRCSVWWAPPGGGNPVWSFLAVPSLDVEPVRDCFFSCPGLGLGSPCGVYFMEPSGGGMREDVWSVIFPLSG